MCEDELEIILKRTNNIIPYYVSGILYHKLCRIPTTADNRQIEITPRSNIPHSSSILIHKTVWTVSPSLSLSLARWNLPQFRNGKSIGAYSGHKSRQPNSSWGGGGDELG